MPDAENEQDLARIAALGLANGGKVLLVGSSGVASALVDQLLPSQVQRAQPGYERLLFVVGSHHMRSAEQVCKLLALPSVATLVLTPGGEVRRAADQGDARIALLQVEGRARNRCSIRGGWSRGSRTSPRTCSRYSRRRRHSS